MCDKEMTYMTQMESKKKRMRVHSGRSFREFTPKEREFAPRDGVPRVGSYSN